jgi:hypothetical protein|tara:strand:- start:241 stop:471 length:231 start_codon:yes stop_codon:yes gene_type:complete
VVTKEYKTGLEFLNEGLCAERAEEVRDMCHQLGEDTEIAVLDGETLSYMLMEMYNRGRNEGAAAALVLSDDRGVLH